MYKDFLSKYKEQEQQFKQEKLPDGKNSWPYIKPTEHRIYENWISQVVDPVTKEFYQSRDQKDPQQARQIIQTIIRVRLPNLKEKLYSVGSLVGYNSFGDEIKTDCHSPEVKQITRFGHKTGVNKNGQLVQETLGPQETINDYTLDYTPENVDQLYANRANETITYVVKEEASGLEIAVRGKTPKESYNLFRNMDFDYLFNVEYKSNKELLDEQKEKDQKYGKK